MPPWAKYVNKKSCLSLLSLPASVFFLIAILLIFVSFVVEFNSLVAKKNRVKNAFASVDVQLKKRYDLVPNLIATVNQYMQHEQGTLAKLTELRGMAQSGRLGTRGRVELENQFSQAMESIMFAVENYPDLKASQNFLALQGSLNEIEEQLSAARRTFNAVTTDYNDSIEMFPSNLLAGLIGYRLRPLFEMPAIERENPNAAKLFAD